MARAAASFRQQQKRLAMFAAYAEISAAKKAGKAKQGTTDLNLERTVIRQSFGEVENLTFAQACICMANGSRLFNTAGTEFEQFEGKTVEYLLTLDGVFNVPTKHGAFAELLDAGVTLKTPKARYSLAEMVVRV